MSLLDDSEITQLARLAFEEDEATDQESSPCGSYVSLALLLTGAGSSFVSAEHVAECSACGRMLTRLLERRCPSWKVLNEYRRPGSGLSYIATLREHIAGCWRCRLRLFFVPRPTDESTLVPRSAVRPLLASSTALLILLTIVWWNVNLRHTRTATSPPAHPPCGDKATPCEQITRTTTDTQTPEQLRKQPKGRGDSGTSKRNGPAAPSTIPLVATFTFWANPERAEGEPNEIRIPSGTTKIRLKVHLSANRYASYGASFSNADGVEFLIRDKLSSTGRFLTIDLPASALPAGDCVLTITGDNSHSAVIAPVQAFSIRVIQQ